MNLFAFVDTHASSKALRTIKKRIKLHRPDAVVCAGDFTVFGHDLEKHLKRIAKLHKHLFLVHGNHEDHMRVRVLCKELGIHFVHKRLHVFNDFVFVGWGGGGFSQRDHELEDWSKTVRKQLAKHRKAGKRIVFIAHAPFYNSTLDELYGDHLGSKSLSAFITMHKPRIAICGHFHENAQKYDTLKKCALFNPGPEGVFIEIA